MIFDHETVQKILPHRSPFLFIDHVDSIELDPQFNLEYVPFKKIDGKMLVGAKIVSSFRVRPDLDILRGHFPGNPIFPGVIQVEMMAQNACMVMMSLIEDPLNTPFEVALVSTNNAKFRKPVVPPMELKVVSVVKKVRGNMMTYDCHISCDQQLMSEAELLATFRLKG
jgi:3-hydroxyacyl-[acyl-carrier-protein] dehydratase